MVEPGRAGRPRARRVPPIRLQGAYRRRPRPFGPSSSRRRWRRALLSLPAGEVYDASLR
ncbi:MAG: hypothetical protein WKG07_46015 [Hymenobacter sp.]